METDSTISWLVLVISVAGFSFISLGKASLASVRRERVQGLVDRAARGSRALERLHSNPAGPAGVLSLLKVLLLSSTLLSSATLVIALTGNHLGWIALGALVVLALLGLLHSAAGALAQVMGERFALSTALAIVGLVTIFRPLLVLEVGAFQRVLRNRADRPTSQMEGLPADLGIPVDADDEPLDEREVRMIRGVVQLDKTTAREIMIPRGDMVAAELGTPLVQLAHQMVESGHSRLPIYEGSLDQIQGIAYARDVLGRLSHGGETPGSLTGDVTRPALFIPESKTLGELLSEFQQRQVHVAIVIDEYGGVSGLVTIEDLLEEIVGEIEDEFDVGEPQIEQISDDEFLMDARVSIDQLEELLHVAVEGDGFDTVGGFVYHRLGKMPSSGDKVEYDGLEIEVVSIMGRRLKQLRVSRSTEGSGLA